MERSLHSQMRYGWLVLLFVAILILFYQFRNTNSKTDSIAWCWKKGAYYSRLTSRMVAVERPRNFHNESEIENELKQRLDTASEKKFIIYWVSSFRPKIPKAPPNREECGNCEITYDRSLLSDKRTGAVVFQFDMFKETDLPKVRLPHQLYIFSTMESSATLKVHGYDLAPEESLGMNATMTYRLDADFLASYQGKSIGDDHMGKNASVYDEILKKKTGMAIAVISDCDATPGARIRINLIKELKMNGLDLHTFGGCFWKKLSHAEMANLIPKYKFYFSYENSYHCEDYITEKFFSNALTHDAVPVVWGAKKEDYIETAPPGSFIFAEDFTTSRDLIDYLEFLNENDQEYIKFHRWRTMPPTLLPQYGRSRGWCSICRAIHGINADDRFKPSYNYNESSRSLFTNGILKRNIPSVIQWYYDDDNPECYKKS